MQICGCTDDLIADFTNFFILNKMKALMKGINCLRASRRRCFIEA
jgi:hypothetical protein